MEKPLFMLPEVDIYLKDNSLPERKTLFVLGGRPADSAWLRTFCGDNLPEIWAVDSGVDLCRKSGLAPSLLIGDMDSASDESVRWAKSCGAEENRHSPNKDLTDFQLAIMLSSIRNSSAPTVLSACSCFGGRFDHLFSILNTFASEGSIDSIKLSRCLMDEREGIFLLYSNESASLHFKKVPQVISLLPISEICREVSLDGVRWPLNKESLKRELPWTISNRIKAESDGDNIVNVRCKEGIVGLYWCNNSSCML